MKAVRLYAQVLVDVAQAPTSGTSLESVSAQLGRFGQMFNESPLVLKVFDNPTLADDDKQKVLKEFSKKADLSALGERFLAILVKRNRLGLLNDILSEVESILVEKRGGLMGELISAVPLDAGVVSGVAQAISKKLNKPVQLKEKVDTSLIAGMRVTVGGVTYDGSARAKLDRLTNSFN